MLVVALLLSVLIGLTLGLLGGGGSILTTPVLIFALDIEPRAAMATSLIVVGATSAVALVSYARAGNVAWRTGLGFGATGMIGAFGGGWVAAFIPSKVLLLLFAAMMVATSVAMFRGRTVPEEAPAAVPFAKILAEGLAVGVLTGLVGAGGGFLVVPALALSAGLPMQKAIGTSLLVIAMKSLAGYLGHAAHVSVDLGLAAAVSVAAIVGSFGGTWLASRVAPDHLRRGFAGFVLLMGAFVILRQI
jgi:uncharacterized membrane protein YfcA